MSIRSAGTGNPARRSASAYCSGVRVVPLVRMQNGTSEVDQRRHEVQRARQRGQPLVVPVAQHEGAVHVEDEPAHLAEAVARRYQALTGPLGAADRQPETRLGDREVVDGRARAELAEQREDRRELRVEVPRRRAGRHHRVDLLGGHVRPQQQLLVADAREPSAGARPATAAAARPASSRARGRSRIRSSTSGAIGAVGRPKPPMAYRMTWSGTVD